MEYLDEDVIIRWVQAVADRIEKPWVRSAEEVEQSGPLIELVGSNHDRFLSDGTKEVFVDYYAPWCNHCVKLHPTFEQVAEYFKYDTDLIIAKFDATQNDIAGAWLTKYPTLLFYPLGAKCQIDQVGCEGAQPIRYYGDRDFNTMKQWLFKRSQVLKNRPKTGAQKTDL